MKRIDGPGASAGRFVPGDPFSQTKGTTITAEWLNSIQEAIARAIELSGQSLDGANDEQLFRAIETMGALGPAERAALRAPSAIPPLAQTGPRAPIQLFDLPGLWICGNAKERPHDGNEPIGNGGAPRGCLVDGAQSSGASSLLVRGLPGVVSPGVGFTFVLAGSGTVYTVGSVTTFDHDTATAELAITPNLSISPADGIAVTFQSRVDNGAGYAIAATVIHIDGLIDSSPCIGTQVTFAGHATVYTVTTRTQWTSPGDCDITITPALTASVADNEIVTITAADESNVDAGSEYFTGRKKGELWPYMAADAQQAHYNQLGGGVAGAYPACRSNTGFNCYSKGFLLPRRIGAGAFLIELDWFGDWNQQETNCLLEWIVAPNLDASAGFDLVGKHCAFQSDVSASTGTRPVQVRMWIIGNGRSYSSNNYSLHYIVHFLVGNTNGVAEGCSAPVVDSWRFARRVTSVATMNLRRIDVLVPILWKFEKNTLAGLPGRRNAAVAALHTDGGSLLRISRHTGRLWMGQH
jgi:hypothetical protein